MRPVHFDMMDEAERVEVAGAALIERGIFWLPGAMLGTHSRRFMQNLREQADDASSWQLMCVKPDFDYVIVDTDRWENFSDWLNAHALQRSLLNESGVREESLPDLPDTVS